MQVFKLVQGGVVDRLIAFDALPESLLTGIRTRDITGLPRYWGTFLTQMGSVRPVFKVETEVLEDRNHKITKTPTGTEPCFWVLEYNDINSDKEKWKDISGYIRSVVDTKVRLRDRIEEMARPMAADSKSDLSIDPEDIPVIALPEEPGIKVDPGAIVRSSEEVISPTGDTVAATTKRRGRPKKVAVEA